MQVRDVMTKDVACVDPETTIARAAQIMQSRNIGALPVAKKDGLIGIVTDRDICCRAIAQNLDPESATVEQIMSKNVATCFEDQELAEAAHIMERKQIRRLPVLSRKSKLVGIMTVGDISQHASRDLTGEIEEQITRH
jgi:CBS domain-containing protein